MPTCSLLTLAVPRRRVLAVAAGVGAALVPPARAARAAGAAAPPSTAFIPGDTYVERYKQKWALSCEFAATHTALRLLGHHVTEDVMRPLLGRGEDPDETFRGEIQADQNLSDYGVHAKGIVRLVDLLKANNHIPRDHSARLLRDLDAIKLSIASGQPVVAWLPLGLRASSRVPVPLSTGKIVTLVYAEHTVTLRGYDGTYFYSLEPYDGSAPRYETAALWRGMSLFDDPAVAIGPTQAVLSATESLAPAPAPSRASASARPSSEFFSESGVTMEGGFYRTYLELGGRATLGIPLTDELSEIDLQTGESKQVVYTEVARLEWYATTNEFGLGFTGQELLELGGDTARLEPTRRVQGAIGEFVNRHGGIERFGYSLSEEVPISSADVDLLPYPMYDAVGQWFQTGMLLWDPYGRSVVPARTGLALLKQRRQTA